MSQPTFDYTHHVFILCLATRQDQSYPADRHPKQGSW